MLKICKYVTGEVDTKIVLLLLLNLQQHFYSFAYMTSVIPPK